ncbi:histidinol-phosphate transaminase [Bifidobacterium sp. M0353]|uniref:histidinol-phosphate transaminase n=1 Tax=Bifidobacterium sp. M0353 TaxID=2751006 RepID=UPI0018DC9A21|nr:histidinol-phosphate transaminase [Bifidobacterium sp. M0353]
MSTIPADLPLRADLVGEEPYGAPQLDVPVCLNVNENPYPLDQEVVDAICERVRQVAPGLNRYPDREHEELRRALAAYLKRESGTSLQPGQIWAANGSNEIMLQLFQAFGGPGRTALGCDPTYSMYPEYARDTFTDWELAHRLPDFSLDIETTIERIKALGPAMVLVTSPNNPTGTPLPMDQLTSLLEACSKVPVAGGDPSARPIVVVDEAYIEFRDPGTPSAVSLIGQYDHLAVSRTMSKAFAFAGARVGYLAASQGIIDAVRIVRMPYHLSALTQAAALAALEHTDLQLARVDQIRQTRQETAEWLAGQQFHGRPLTVVPSASNFILFGIFPDRDAVFEAMKDEGVLIRAVGPQGYLRVCMGTDAEMERFRQTLVHVLKRF